VTFRSSQTVWYNKMTTKYKVIVAVSVVIISAAIGRYTAPEKIKIETKTVEVIKEVKVKDTTKAKTYKKTEDIKPGGEKITVTTVTESDKTDVDNTAVITATKAESKTITEGTGKLNISALAGTNVTNPGNGMLYGVHISKDILGPLNIGIWGLNNGTAGCSVGITF